MNKKISKKKNRKKERVGERKIPKFELNKKYVVLVWKVQKIKREEIEIFFLMEENDELSKKVKYESNMGNRWP